MLLISVTVLRAEEAVQNGESAAGNKHQKADIENVAIGLSQKTIRQVVSYLNVMLADEYILFTKLFKYHWNVTGMAFGPLHKLFAKQYERVFQNIDEIAERVRALGHKPIGTLTEFIQYANLQEHPKSNPTATDMLANIQGDQETIAYNMRKWSKDIARLGDSITVNLIEEYIKKHEKDAWMVRAHLVE